MSKPLLFGDTTLDADRIEEIRALDYVWDRSYVPGYGELRRENEHRVKRGEKPLPCPRLQWIRLNQLDGREVGDRDMLEWAMNGYRFMDQTELEQFGFRLPPTGYVDAQGRIRREDLALAFVDEEQARKNKERRAVQQAVIPIASENEEVQWSERKNDVADIAELGAKYLD